MNAVSDAIKTLISDGRTERLTKSGYKRANSACQRLCLTNGETDEILQFLEYHDSNGNPHSWLTAKKKKP